LDITLLIENRPITGSANAMWHLLDRIDHPAVACCWNTLSAFIAGDAPAVAVPTLNSRIQCVALEDAKTPPQTAQPSAPPQKVELGTGDVPIRKTLDRLRGIGFGRGLIVSPATSPSIEDLEQALLRSLDTLRQWNAVPAQTTTT
jgi:sugar phosphate isomerase/epimerase